MKPLITNVQIGADIELFLAEKATNRVVSAEPYIRGSKFEPFNFDLTNKYFSTSLDNVLAEFNIPPVLSKNDFYNNIQHCVDFINKSLPQELCTVILPAANLDPIFLQTEQAQRFGCESDFCAYTGRENGRPSCSDQTLRSAGGHIHVGYDNPNPETNIELIKAMDLFIGIPSVLQEPDNKRKELYGKAGAFRHKNYGVEYRSVSNYYLESKKLTYWMYDAIQRAIEFINTGNYLEQPIGGLIQNTINNNNKETAAKIISDFKIKIAA